jgi:uncharacterized protein YifN (PemK superfamily)
MPRVLAPVSPVRAAAKLTAIMAADIVELVAACEEAAYYRGDRWVRTAEVSGATAERLRRAGRRGLLMERRKVGEARSTWTDTDLGRAVAAIVREGSRK